MGNEKNKVNVLGVIPARMASVRLPEKPLKMIYGKTLIQRVWERASAAKSVSEVVIATDDSRIEAAALGFGARVIMTDPALPSGSARAATVAKLLAAEREVDWDAVVNIQGDMPFIRGEVIDRAVNFLLSSPPEFVMGTIAMPLVSAEAFNSPMVVKVALGAEGRALYFSRAPIPCSRDGNRLQYEGRDIFGYKHLGLYVLRQGILDAFSSSELSPFESIEKLEQLRLLEHGHPICVAVIPEQLIEPAVEVDTPADLLRAEQIATELEG